MRKPKLIITLTLSAVITIVVGPIPTSVIAAALPPTASPFTWSLLIIVVVGAVVIALKQLPDQEKTEPVEVVPRGRDDLLRNVKAQLQRKRKGLLQGAIYIRLELRELSTALSSHPTEQSVQLSDPSASYFTIVQAYENAAGLLILGEPGSGKTVLLLDLALDHLLPQAEQDQEKPIPVVLNLASWTRRRQPIGNWLVEELSKMIGVERQVSQGWVNSGWILPLFDGLDQVHPVYRTACLEAINAYLQKLGPTPVVVCCRSADYLAQTKRLELNGIIVIQPLKIKQIDDCLSNAGEQLAEVCKALHDDKSPVMREWREVVSTPLMLHVLIQAFQGISVADLQASGSAQAQQRQLLENYVQCVLEGQNQKTETHYTPEETRYWLSWLAWQLTHRQQKDFSLKQMEPDWLAIGQARRTYIDRAVRWSLGLGYGLFGGLFSELFAGFFFHKDFFGLIVGLFLGIPFVLNIELVDREMKIATGTGLSWRSFVNFLKERLFHGLLGGLLGGYLIGWIIELFSKSDLSDFVGQFERSGLDFGTSLLFWLGCVITIVLIVATSPALSKKPPHEDALCYQVEDIRPIPVVWEIVYGLPIFIGGLGSLYACFELFSQAIQKSGIGILLGLIGGLLSGLLYGILTWAGTSLVVLPILVWISTFSFGNLGGHERRDDFAMPKQDIWYTAGKGIFLGLGCGLIVGFLIGLYQVVTGMHPGIFSIQISTLFNGWNWLVSGHFSALVIWTIHWVVYGLVLGLLSGAFFGLLLGGGVCIKHMIIHSATVRMWLGDEMYKYAPNSQFTRYPGYVPDHFVVFLDYAVDRVLLRKTGNGYTFVPFLQEVLSENFSALIAAADLRHNR